MKYYKAKQYIDDHRAYGGVIVETELFTTDEMKRYNLLMFLDNFEVVDTKPKNTYFCFGARFEMEVKNNEIL